MAAIMIDVKCITDLHVGNGDVNYNIIDNEVERDPVTGYPIINSSGVKGALREFFKKSVDKDTLNKIFGDDTAGKSTPGRIRILGADFLYMPVRASAGNKPYYFVTTKEALAHYREMAKMLEVPVLKITSCKADNGAEGEGISFTEAVQIGENTVYVLNDERDFRKLSLPVVARNHLNNGKSESLWYEEIVPHESRFFFTAISDEGDNELLKKFKSGINDKIVQFGADASIGRGLCRLHVIE